MMKYLLLIVVSFGLAACGMNTDGTTGGVSYKPLTTADQKLGGQWMAEKLNEDGDRVLLTVTPGNGERQVNITAIRSAGDAINIDTGSYAIDGNKITFTFQQLSAYTSPFTVNAIRLTLGTDVYNKVTYSLDSPQLGGQIQITQAAIDEDVSVNSVASIASVGSGDFVPGEILVKYKDGSLGKIVMASSNSEVAALAVQSAPETLSAAAFQSLKISDLEVKRMKDLKKATLDRIAEIRRLKRVPEVSSSVAGLTVASAGSVSGKEIEYAVPNTIVHVQSDPNDAFFDEQWNLDVLDITDAWGVYNTMLVAEKDEPVVVAVIDTGIVNPLNPDLQGRVLVNQGYDFVSAKVGTMDLQLDGDNGPSGNGPDSNPTDPGDQIGTLISGSSSSWHGTHIAGIIAAAANNQIGIAGIATANVKILPLRAMGKKGSGTLFDVAQAISYAAKLPNIVDCTYTAGQVGDDGQEQTTYTLDNATCVYPPARPKAAVINMSLGEAMTAEDADVLNDAIDAAYNAGVVVVSSAGNYGKGPGYCKNITGPTTYTWVQNPSCNFYPAANSHVISVGAITPNLSLASYSNYGSANSNTTSVVAPGGSGTDGILSTISTTVLGGYAELKGTSQAAAHVSAVAAMVVAAKPGAYAFTSAAVNQVRNDLESTAIDRGDAGKDIYFGNGLLNACGAIMKAMGQNNPFQAPILNLSSEAVNFGSLGTTHTVLVTSGCGGFALNNLQVTKPAVDTWLTVAFTTTSTPSQVTITVNRQGLESGEYNSSVTISSEAGTKTVTVKMTVGAISVPEDDEENDAIDDLIEQVDDFLSDKPGYDNTSDIGEVILVLIDANSGTPIVKTQTDLSANYNYYFGGVPVGSYYLMGGVDENSDGKICDPNSDELCIYYPTAAAPEVIEVTGSTKRNDLNISY